MIDIELFIDIVIILLLIPAIFFSCRLSRNLNILRHNQDSLPQLIQTLNEASEKAEDAVARLKNATALAVGELKDAADNAKTAKDNLAFVCEKAENLSDLLENTIYASRNVAENAQPVVSEPVPELSEKENLLDGEEPSEAENELLQALRSIK